MRKMPVSAPVSIAVDVYSMVIFAQRLITTNARSGEL
jgi:hypothetical protein